MKMGADVEKITETREARKHLRVKSAGGVDEQDDRRTAEEVIREKLWRRRTGN